jgi:hypothetical protein
MVHHNSQITVWGDWALGADALQWILCRKHHHVSFVRSERRVLERCMQEKGCPRDARVVLLAGLPTTFDQWKITGLTVGLGDYDVRRD